MRCASQKNFRKKCNPCCDDRGTGCGEVRYVRVPYRDTVTEAKVLRDILSRAVPVTRVFDQEVREVVEDLLPDGTIPLAKIFIELNPLANTRIESYFPASPQVGQEVAITKSGDAAGILEFLDPVSGVFYAFADKRGDVMDFIYTSSGWRIN